jgi:hypothetical protein
MNIAIHLPFQQFHRYYLVSTALGFAPMIALCVPPAWIRWKSACAVPLVLLCFWEGVVNLQWVFQYRVRRSRYHGAVVQKIATLPGHARLLVQTFLPREPMTYSPGMPREGILERDETAKDAFYFAHRLRPDLRAASDRPDYRITRVIVNRPLSPEETRNLPLLEKPLEMVIPRHSIGVLTRLRLISYREIEYWMLEGPGE